MSILPDEFLPDATLIAAIKGGINIAGAKTELTAKERGRLFETKIGALLRGIDLLLEANPRLVCTGEAGFRDRPYQATELLQALQTRCGTAARICGSVFVSIGPRTAFNNSRRRKYKAPVFSHAVELYAEILEDGATHLRLEARNRSMVMKELHMSSPPYNPYDVLNMLGALARCLEKEFGPLAPPSGKNPPLAISLARRSRQLRRE